jgi:hypothetical protein
VLVATQTRVVEAVADPGGELVAVTPVLSVVPAAAGPDPAAIVAAICAPSVAALAHHRLAGTGMGRGTVRLRAADVAAFPLPTDGAAWANATAALRGALSSGGAAGWQRYAEAALDAHGLHGRDDLRGWWLERRP